MLDLVKLRAALAKAGKLGNARAAMAAASATLAAVYCSLNDTDRAAYNAYGLIFAADLLDELIKNVPKEERDKEEAKHD